MVNCSSCGHEIVEVNKTLIIKGLGIEVETKISQKGKKFSELIIPKGWRLLTTNEIIFLHNNYGKQLNLENTWEFIEQPFNSNKEKGLVAWFDAAANKADLSCYWNPLYSFADLGVRFCRNIKESK